MFMNAFFRKSMLFAGMFLAVATEGTAQEQHFDPTIPVVDMQEFYNLETRPKFYAEVGKALHEVGFFAVVNTGLDMDALEAGYAAFKEFFRAPRELKMEIERPELSKQRGYIANENAQGFGKPDYKEFLHIGHDNNFWPDWMDLQHPAEKLMNELDGFGEYIQMALSDLVGKPDNFFIDMTKKGDSLLRPIHYMPDPEPGQYWAAEHTDIDLFTILPMATEDGLQLFLNNEWIDVRVPPNAFIVNAGDMLQNMTNGYIHSGKHRVVSKPGVERFSIVYFVHPRSDDDMSPLQSCIDMTTGYAQFPQATRLELLGVRLREISLASPEFVKYINECGINERIRDLVLSGLAHPAVQLTYEIWLKWLANHSAEA